MQGEAGGADGGAAASDPEDGAEVITEGGSTDPQIFSVGARASHRKKMPSRTFLAREEKSVPAFQASKDRLIVLSGPVQLATSNL